VTDFFPAAVQIVLESEGVFSNQPGDSGGETVYGIARNKHPELVDWPPTKDEAILVYRTQYWNPHRCGEMPWPWALAIFDGEVNQGSIINLAQKALGVSADGIVGIATLTQMQRATPEDFDLFIAKRSLAYVNAGLWSIDGEGWMKRLSKIARLSATIPQ